MCGRGMKDGDRPSVWVCLFTCFLFEIQIYMRGRYSESRGMEPRTGSRRATWHFHPPREQTGGMVLGVNITKRISLRRGRSEARCHSDHTGTHLSHCVLVPTTHFPYQQSVHTPDPPLHNGLTIALNEQFSPHFCGQSSAFVDGTQHRPGDLKVLKFLDLSTTFLQGYYENYIMCEAGSELGNRQYCKWLPASSLLWIFL